MATSYENNKEVILKQQITYRDNAKKEYMATYRKNNKDMVKEYKAAYRENNKDAIKEYRAAYYEKNKDAIKEYRAAYREKNKDPIKEYSAAYCENNRDLVRQCVLNNQRKNIESKKYFCTVCDLACISNYAFKNHLGTLKHSYAWLNSVE